MNYAVYNWGVVYTHYLAKVNNLVLKSQALLIQDATRGFSNVHKNSKNTLSTVISAKNILSLK